MGSLVFLNCQNKSIESEIFFFELLHLNNHFIGNCNQWECFCFLLARDCGNRKFRVSFSRSVRLFVKLLFSLDDVEKKQSKIYTPTNNSCGFSFVFEEKCQSTQRYLLFISSKINSIDHKTIDRSNSSDNHTRENPLNN